MGEGGRRIVHGGLSVVFVCEHGQESPRLTLEPGHRHALDQVALPEQEQ